MQTIDIDNLTDTLIDDLKKYRQQKISNVNQILEEEAEKLLEDIKTTAPVSNKNGIHLKDTFIKEAIIPKKKKNLKVNQKYSIHSKSNYHKYSIVHLVELGFTNKRANKYIPGKNFMQNALNKRKKEFSERIEEELRR